MTRRLAMMLGAAGPLMAYSAMPDQGNRLSPHETVSLDLGGKRITISYGRPYLKGRQVGKQVAPYGEVWRLGADEATKITVSAYTTIPGAFELLPGSYSLFAIPGPDKWTMIVNKTPDQWGAFSYKQSEDLGRFDLTVKQLSKPIEQFTITLGKQLSNVANLSLAWGAASVSTTLKVL